MVSGMILPDESPHEKLSRCYFLLYSISFGDLTKFTHFTGIYIEIAWTFSTVFGILLFLVEIAILFWVKFWVKKNEIFLF